MKEFMGKKVKAIYQDGTYRDGNPSFSRKIGIVIEISETHLTLDLGSHQEALNLTKILRVEEIK